MANIKQDELWVDLLFDGTTSFYLALAESKRFRLGHIRNGKISYQLYPKRKDFVSLNVAIQNLAAMQQNYASSLKVIFPWSPWIEIANFPKKVSLNGQDECASGFAEESVYLHYAFFPLSDKQEFWNMLCYLALSHSIAFNVGWP